MTHRSRQQHPRMRSNPRMHSDSDMHSKPRTHSDPAMHSKPRTHSDPAMHSKPRTHSEPSPDSRPAAHRVRSALVTPAVVAIGLALLVVACSSGGPAPQVQAGGGATSVTIGGANASGGSGPSTSTTSASTGSSSSSTSSSRGGQPTAGPNPPTPAACLSPEWVRALPLRARLAQLVMVQLAATPTAQSLDALAQQGAGGVIIGSGQESAATPALLALKTPMGLPLWAATDQEGGGVARLSKITPPLPWPRELATNNNAAKIEQLVSEHAKGLRAAGIVVDFAPVVDVATASYTNASIGKRSFSDKPAVVAEDARAFSNGLHSANVMATLKHFPGHGRASGDTHAQAATTPALLDMNQDLQPYRDLLTGPNALPTDTTAVMVGHLDVPGLTDGGLPTSLNPKAYDLLRTQIGFKGVVFTDDLGGMKAITNRMPLPQAVRTSIIAGADVAIWIDSGQLVTTLDGLEQAVADKSLPEDRVDLSATRVLRAKQALGLPVC